MKASATLRSLSRLSHWFQFTCSHASATLFRQKARDSSSAVSQPEHALNRCRFRPERATATRAAPARGILAIMAHIERRRVMHVALFPIRRYVRPRNAA